MAYVSIFKNVKNTKATDNILFDEYLDGIENGKWQNIIIDVRSTSDQKLKAELKSKLPGITPSGTFPIVRQANKLEAHSGFISIDIDDKDMLPNQSAESIKQILSQDPYTYACHLSAGGKGIVAYVKIDPTKHLESFLALEKYYIDNYQIVIDPSCKDVSRFRYVSLDQGLYKNIRSKTFKQYIPQKKAEPKSHSFIFTNSDLDHVFSEVISKGINLTEDYHDWYRVGGAMQNHFGGRQGRDMFHQLSQMSAKYNQEHTDKLYDILEKRNADKIATIGTFLWMCKSHGININTPQTEDNIRTTKSRIRQVGTNGGYKNTEDAIASAKQELELAGKLHPEFDAIAEAVSKLPHDKLKPTSDSIIDEIETYLNSFNIKCNEITQKLEIKGNPITDTDINSLYKDAIKQLGEKCTRDKFMTVLFSDAIQKYNPFTQFYSKNLHLKPSGNFDKLCSAIKYKHTFQDENGNDMEMVNEYLEIFLKKWLLGIISSSLGTYSLSILVLTGGQGTGKTKFFRELLPEDMKNYWAESDLDEGKDSEILMTQKLLIVDDEFGGKSKRDAKRLKNLSSKQTFSVRKPYARTPEDLTRYAVLAGTTNEEQILNDPTGNRRIIPINITEINFDILNTIDRTELFMELYHEHIANPEKFILTPNEIKILNITTEQNEESSIEEDMILQYFNPYNDQNTKFFTATEIKNLIEARHPNIRLNHIKLGSIIQHKYKIKRIKYQQKKGYWLHERIQNTEY